ECPHRTHALGFFPSAFYLGPPARLIARMPARCCDGPEALEFAHSANSRASARVGTPERVQGGSAGSPHSRERPRSCACNARSSFKGTSADARAREGQGLKFDTMEPALKSQDQIADTCDQLASAADGLLSQLPRKGGQQYRYFYGVLVRYRTMTHDIARLIRNNNTDHFTSVFALFRILLDDMIRVLTVWASNTPTEQLNQIDADAHRHRFESLRLRTEYTQEYANSDIGGKMKIKYDEEKAEFYANPKHARFFKNGTPLRAEERQVA